MRQPGKAVPTYAWRDSEARVVHILYLTKRNCVGYMNLWIDDLRQILDYETTLPTLFVLSPDMETIEKNKIPTGKLPKHWQVVANRGYVKPGVDCIRDRIV